MKEVVTLLFIWSSIHVQTLSGTEKFECVNSGFVKIKSSHAQNDRQLTFECGRVPAVKDSCYWTDYSNTFDGELSNSCKPNYFMSGVESYYSTHHKDRRWQFKCCEFEKNFRLSSCKTTPYINKWHQDMDYEVETASSVIVGMESFHRNDKE